VDRETTRARLPQPRPPPRPLGRIRFPPGYRAMPLSGRSAWTCDGLGGPY
jgi:hypothetical protein